MTVKESCYTGRCAFCNEASAIMELTRDSAVRNAMFDELFDRADRCRKIRQAYGRKHGR